MHKYSLNELKNETNESLLQKLKSAWHYSDEEPLIVYGKLKKSDNGTIYFLEKLKSVYNSFDLYYPLTDSFMCHDAYVGNLKKFNIDGDVNTRWVKAQVKLSPQREREKHKNPFGLMVKKIDVLQEIPFVDIDEAKNDIDIVDEVPYLKQSFYDYYLQKAKEDMSKDLQVVKNKTEREIKEIQQSKQNLEEYVKVIQENIKDLETKETQGKNQCQNIENDIKKYQTLLINKKDAYKVFLKELEQNMAHLNEVLQAKIDILKRLDLIEEKDLQKLHVNFDNQDTREGHDFLEVFNADYSQAISYIQSYMWQQNIIYKRSVLEDFFAMIMTNDLIILAGDSGSGKTNLVKSFAKAIGGKSFIVPVKPNWTSAEDLLGYYNPLENKYLSTKFLDALLEAEQNPHIPYFICLDEMNLARVEYYFADFLSLLEEREKQPEIQLFSSTEGDVLASELKIFISLINEVSEKVDKGDFQAFSDIMKDESFNAKLHEMCGFKEGDSLLKYHSRLKKMLNSFINTPATIKLPKNVRIIGAINVDETTHYLSPKILDRAHIMKFGSPLLEDWGKVENEIQIFDLDMSLPITFAISHIGEREVYPEFDRNSELVQKLITLVRDYLDPLGIEFGLRTIRQALGYENAMNKFTDDPNIIFNNIVLHKVLPKLLFDGEKKVNDTLMRKDYLLTMSEFINEQLASLDPDSEIENSIKELERVIKNAEANDWVVNYWSR